MAEIIKIDIDCTSKRKLFKNFKKRKWLVKFLKLCIVNVQVCETKHGFHIYIECSNRLSKQDIVFLQLAFGSDFMREAFYWKRIKGKILPHNKWNILFQRKYNGLGKLISQEKYRGYLSDKIWGILLE